MRRATWTVAGAFLLAGTSLVAAGGQEPPEQASVPRLVRFSGTLREAGERPARGAVEMSFSLFQEESGGEPLWFETQTVEVDAQGRYNVLLGAMHADGLPVELFTSGEARWLEVMVGKNPQPRILLVSVPYALKAGDAATLGGKPASAYALADASRQTTTAVVAAGITSSGETAQASVTQPVAQPSLVTTGQTHFTDTTADYVVRITQNGTGRGLYGLSQSGDAVYGQILGTSGTTYGVRGITPSTTGAGVFGSNTATTGAAYGVRGNSSSTGGAGVAGFNTATTGSAFGIIGQTSSTAGVALFGRALAATGATVGLQGVSDSTSGFGINALASANSGATTGLLARANSASGTAAVLYNEGGGKILSGRTTGSVEKFSVDGNGNLHASNLSTGLVQSAFVWANNNTGPIVSGSMGGVSGQLGTTYDGTAVGVHGYSVSNGGIGTRGDGDSYGVYGRSVLGTGIFGWGLVGVRGRYDVFSGDNVKAIGELGTIVETNYFAGAYGRSLTYGVYGEGGPYGVKGTGTTYGIYGTGPTGVYGTGSSYGVYGNSTSFGVAGIASGGGSYGVYGQATTYGVYGSGAVGVQGSGGTWGVYASGNLGASGTKSAVVALPDNRVVELYAVESPEVWFEDFGSVVMTNGIAHVTLESTFEQTINTESNYYVFLTPNGETNGLYVAQKSPNGFQIREANGGRSNVAVDYRIVARRRGFENVRLQAVDADPEAASAVREQNRARHSRPTLSIPKKPPGPPRPDRAPQAGTKSVQGQQPDPSPIPNPGREKS